MMQPQVSIIIPCYNQERYILDCLQSVKQQSFVDWECIIINDGSTDQSKELIESYIQNEPQFKLINGTNQGVSAARNTGFKSAKGKYLQFLDADDLILPDKIETHVKFLEKNPDIDIVYCRYKHLFQETGKTASYPFNNVSDKPLENFLFLWDRGVSIPPHAPLYRKAIWKEDYLPYPEDYNLRYEDWVFWVRTSLLNLSFYETTEPLVLYRIHGANFCANTFQVAVNMLNAAKYIQGIIPEELGYIFWEKTVQHVLNNYHSEKIQTENLKYFQVKILRNRFKFLKPLISNFKKIFK